MLKNYLLVSFRNQIRNKGYFTINLFGLTLGIVSSLYGFLWIKDELSINTFHNDMERIALVRANWQQSNGNISTFSNTQGTVYQAAKDEVAEVEHATRVSTWGNSILMKSGENSFIEKGIYADKEFFEIFNFPFTEGDAQAAITQQNTIAISEELAKKYFINSDPLGKTFELNGRVATVSAIFKNVPSNSTLQFDFAMPFEDFLKDYGYEADWTNYDFYTFVKLNNASDFEAADLKFESMIQNHLSEDVNEWLFLQPFNDIYLYSKFTDGKVTGGRIEYVRIFSAVILFILFIACINFVNLATSRAANRSKEVGVRKVNGAHKSQLVFQFLTESFLITLISLVVSVVVVELFLPGFNFLTEKSIIINYGDGLLLFGLAAIVIVVTLASGLYPAFYLSGFKPALILKGSSSVAVGGITLRKFLVTFQFALSVILLISASVISNQIDFIRNTNLGFDRENVVIIWSRPGISNNFESFRNKALENPEIVNLGASNQILLDVSNSTTSVNWPGKTDLDDIQFRAIITGMDFLETMGIELIEGRSFNRDFPYSQDDSLKQFIITKKSAEMMKLENPLGALISLWDSPGTIVGVVDDFNSKSIHSRLDPIVFMLDSRNQGRVFLKLQEGQTLAGVQIIENLYKEFEQNYPFEYSFMDDSFDRQYKLESLTEKLANMFSLMAIAISCLGLFGLTSFLIDRKTREIGIRKVLGASVSGLIIKLSSGFMKLFVLAVIFGSSIAYFLMINYLEKFVYRIDFNFWIIGITAGVLFLISQLTVIYHISKAALSNPAEILRNE